MLSINKIRLFVSLISCILILCNSADLNLRRKRVSLPDTKEDKKNDLEKFLGVKGTDNKLYMSKQRRNVEDMRNIQQRELLNEYGAVLFRREYLNSIVLEEIASIVETLDLSMSYIATPTSSPTQSEYPTLNPSLNPSINCASPAARESDIKDIVDSISPASVTTDPSTHQYEAFQWILNTDTNTNACDGSTSVAQRYGLAMLYFSMNGPLWTNNDKWLNTSESECEWYGITCEANGISIREINLNENNLSGSIPDEFFSTMQNLTLVGFYQNQITGTLPVSIASLSQLSRLDIEDNRFTGSLFVPELFNLTNTLKQLWVSFNEFEDEIPPTIDQFNKLTNLWTADNKLHGTLPTELGSLTSLESMVMYDNFFTGVIPSELGNLQSSLTWIDIRNSSLTGTIPEEIFELTNLSKLILNNNTLSGSIPTKASSLVALNQLFLSNNLFTGLLPDLTNADGLVVLDIKNNKFSGSLPDMSQWSNLTYIDVSNNELIGSISSGVFNNKLELELAYFSNNSFVGTIPPNYFLPPKLEDLYLDGNEMTGTIPSPPLDSLKLMEELLFNNNNLTGSVPADLCTIRENSNQTFVNLFADCLPDPNNGNLVKNFCPIGCCNACFP